MSYSSHDSRPEVVPETLGNSIAVRLYFEKIATFGKKTVIIRTVVAACAAVAVAAAAATGWLSQPDSGSEQAIARSIGYGDSGHALRNGPLNANAIRTEANVFFRGRVTGIGDEFVMMEIPPAPPIEGRVVTYDVTKPFSAFRQPTAEMVVPEEMVPARVGSEYVVAASQGDLMNRKNVLRPVWVGELVSGKWTDLDHTLELSSDELEPLGASLSHPIPAAS